MSRGKAAERGKRASDEAAFLRGELTVLDYGHAVEARARDRDNAGKRGGQLTVSNTLIAALAAVRDAKQMAYRELHGCLRKISGGRCAMSRPRLCRRVNALGIGAFRGGLRVGGFEVSFRRWGGATVASVRPARRRRRAKPQMATGHHGGMAVISCGPGRAPEPGCVIDATFVSTGNRSAGRMEKWGQGVGRRDNQAHGGQRNGNQQDTRRGARG